MGEQGRGDHSSQTDVEAGWLPSGAPSFRSRADVLIRGRWEDEGARCKKNNNKKNSAGNGRSSVTVTAPLSKRSRPKARV